MQAPSSARDSHSQDQQADPSSSLSIVPRQPRSPRPERYNPLCPSKAYTADCATRLLTLFLSLRSSYRALFRMSVPPFTEEGGSPVCAPQSATRPTCVIRRADFRSLSLLLYAPHLSFDHNNLLKSPLIHPQPRIHISLIPWPSSTRPSPSSVNAPYLDGWMRVYGVRGDVTERRDVVWYIGDSTRLSNTDYKTNNLSLGRARVDGAL